MVDVFLPATWTRDSGAVDPGASNEEEDDHQRLENGTDCHGMGVLNGSEGYTGCEE